MLELFDDIAAIYSSHFFLKIKFLLCGIYTWHPYPSKFLFGKQAGSVNIKLQIIEIYNILQIVHFPMGIDKAIQIFETPV